MPEAVLSCDSAYIEVFFPDLDETPKEIFAFPALSVALDRLVSIINGSGMSRIKTFKVSSPELYLSSTFNSKVKVSIVAVVAFTLITGWLQIFEVV